MKKFTGTILLTSALLLHVALIIATEKSYIFSSADYMATQPAPEHHQEMTPRTVETVPILFSRSSHLNTASMFAADASDNAF